MRQHLVFLMAMSSLLLGCFNIGAINPKLSGVDKIIVDDSRVIITDRKLISELTSFAEEQKRGWKRSVVRFAPPVEVNLTFLEGNQTRGRLAVVKDGLAYDHEGFPSGTSRVYVFHKQSEEGRKQLLDILAREIE